MENTEVIATAECPVRGVAWRWKMAAKIGGRRYSSSSGDGLVDRAAQYLRGMDNPSHAFRQSETLRERDAVFEEAFDIYVGPCLARACLESLLLADLPNDAISTRCNLSPEVVEVYAQLFFDVRDRLDDVKWVEACVLQSDPFDLCGDEQLASVWKLVAFHYGADALDLVIAATQETSSLTATPA